MTKEESIELLKRYEEGCCTSEERILVENWYNERLSNAEPVGEIDFKAASAAIWNSLEVPKVKSLNYKRWAVAAAVLLIISIPAFYVIKRQQKMDDVATMVQDIQPGANRAILRLADGSQIRLDDVKDGEIAAAAGVSITKAGNGKVIYTVKSAASHASALSYNTISTPRGGQYQIILPDGTHVFLNAGSSLKYPTRFALSERIVSLTGEAYFDVQKNPEKPFIVVSSGQRVSVLGTNFNVSCYSSEPIRTTLEEGKVEISKTNSPQRTTLKPGEQSIVTSEGIEVRQVNLKAAIAWRNEMFIFRSTSLKDVMTQFSRWYDVDVDFSTIPDQAFHGDIPRNLSLLKVLDIINAYSEYQFTLEGRRIVRKRTEAYR
jgi:transmembrane sensor